MSRAGEHFLGIILLPAGHAGNSPAAPLLGLIGIHRKAFDVAETGDGQHAFLFLDQVLNVHFSAHRADFRAAGIGKLIFELHRFFSDDGAAAFLRRKNRVKFVDLRVQLGQFILQLLPFQTGQPSQGHLHDGGSLYVVKFKPVHQPLLAFGNVGRGLENIHHFVDKVQRLAKGF